MSEARGRCENEISPPKISASGRGRCRAASLVARREGASLSDAAGALIVGAPPGGVADIRCATDRSVVVGASGADIIARLFGQWLSERIGQQIIVEDIRPVAHLAGAPLVLVVHPSVPARSIPAFVAHVNANPGKINMASAGTGSTPHVTGELFKMMAKADMMHVPYRGAGPAMTDLLGGQVQVLFDNVPSAIEYIRAGRVRALGVTTVARSEALPDVPAIADSVPGYEASVWYGISAPGNTPIQIVDRLNREINAILQDSKVKTRLAELGVTGTGGSPETFGKIVADETDKWGKVVRSAGIKPE